MSFEIYIKDGYMHKVDFLVTVHQFCVMYRMGVELEVDPLKDMLSLHSISLSLSIHTSLIAMVPIDQSLQQRATTSRLSSNLSRVGDDDGLPIQGPDGPTKCHLKLPPIMSRLVGHR